MQTVETITTGGVTRQIADPRVADLLERLAEAESKIQALENPATKGLSYEFVDDGDGRGAYYICTGIGEATDSDVVIPNFVDGIPVRQIGDEAFRMARLNSLTIPENVIEVRGGALHYAAKTVIIKGQILDDEAIAKFGNTFYLEQPYWAYEDIVMWYPPFGDIAVEWYQGGDGVMEDYHQYAEAHYEDDFYTERIYVRQSSDELYNAPWGAGSATIYYNSEV